MENRTVIVYGGELYHHGIKGQKWGDRNGPPYPLDVNDHSALERKKGWRTSLSKSASDTKRGLAKATLRGGLIGRAIYKHKNADAIKRYKAEKQEIKNTKKMKKIDKYRNKMAIELRNESERWNERAKKERDSIKSLKKEGINSKEYTDFRRSKMDKLKLSENTNMLDVGLTLAGKVAIGTYYNKHADKYIGEMIKTHSANGKQWSEKAKNSNSRYERVMNMDINEFTSKKDIRKARRGQ